MLDVDGMDKAAVGSRAGAGCQNVTRPVPHRYLTAEIHDAGCRMYNRTLDVDGVGKMTDGVQCFDQSRIRLSKTLFADSLFGGVQTPNPKSQTPNPKQKP